MISDATLRRALPDSAVDLLGDLIRWTLWALVFVIWAAFLQVYLRMIRLTLSDPTHSDFTIFYYTARLVRDGLPMYGVSPARYGVTWAGDHLGNLNPPHFQFVAIPLGYLSYGQALVVWVLLGVACLGASVTLIVRELGIPWSWPRFWLWGACTLSSACFTTVAVTCEMTFILMLPFTLGWRAWRAGRWGAAGAWLGICASLKLFLLLLLPWLIWHRRWRAVGAFASSATILVLAGVFVFGVQSYQLWLATLGKVGWWWLPMNASWQGIVSRALEGGASVAPILHRPDRVTLVAVCGSGVVALMTLGLAIRRRAVSSDWPFLFVLLGAILSSPLGWVYYLPFAYGPALGWMGAGRGWEGIRRAGTLSIALCSTGLALLYIPHESTFLGQPSGLASVTIASAYFWGLISVWLGLMSAKVA